AVSLRCSPQKGHNDAVNTELPRAALLVLDVQTTIVEPAPESFFVAMRRAVDVAHEVGIQVIYIRVELRPGHVGVSPRNKRLTRAPCELVRGKRARRGVVVARGHVSGPCRSLDEHGR